MQGIDEYPLLNFEKNCFNKPAARYGFDGFHDEPSEKYHYRVEDRTDKNNPRVYYVNHWYWDNMQDINKRFEGTIINLRTGKEAPFLHMKEDYLAMTENEWNEYQTYADWSGSWMPAFWIIVGIICTFCFKNGWEVWTYIAIIFIYSRYKQKKVRNKKWSTNYDKRN